MSTWFYAGAERQQLGPLSTDELKQYFHSERITLDTLVWRDGMLHWRPLGDLAQQLGLLEAPPAVTDTGPGPIPFAPPPPPPTEAPAPPPAPEPTPATPPGTGRAVFTLGSEPSPVPIHRRAEPRLDTASAGAAVANPYASGHAPLHARAPAADADVVYAGFWKRVAASIIDSFILSIVAGLCGEVLGTILADLVSGGEIAVLVMTLLCTLALYACYFAWFHSTLNLATPGKMAIGIKVVRGNGEPIGFLRGIARFFAMALSTLPVCLGYLMAAFTPRKQSLHDLLCDTVVVDKWAYTAQPEMQRRELGTVAVLVLGAYALLIVLVIVAGFVLGIGDAMRQLR